MPSVNFADSQKRVVQGIALWSTDYHELTGQAIVTRRVVERIFSEHCLFLKYVFPSSVSWKALRLWLLAIVRLWGDFICRRIGMLYVVCSRSNGGFVRDIPALILAKTGVRVVVHSHGSDTLDLFVRKRVSPLARWVYQDCHLVVPSHHLYEALTPYVRGVDVCENFYAYDQGEFDDGRPELTDKLIILWNSNVMASKGFFALFTALEIIHREKYPISFISLGKVLSDKEFGGDVLRAHFDALEDTEWFDYQGWKPQGEAVKMLAKADVVCLLSEVECQPLAIIEAICAGKAIILTDIPAHRAMVGDYPANFVPVKSIDALVASLRELAEEKALSPVKFHAKRSQFALKARERFSPAKFDEKMKFILIKQESAGNISC